MSCNESSGALLRHVRSLQSTEYLFEPFSPWYPVVGVDAVRVSVQQAGGAVNQTDFETKFAIQYAALRTETPTAWTAYGSARTGAPASGCGDTPIAADANANMWFRIGVGVKYAAGFSPDGADVTLDATWNACGRIADARTFDVATSPVGHTSTMVLTDWLPRLDLDRIKASIEPFSMQKTSGTFNFQLAYQTADTEIESPGAWTAIGSSYSNNSGTPNTGELSLPPTAAMWVRFGIQYWQTTSGLTTMSFNTIIGVRKGVLGAPTDWGTKEGGLALRWNGATTEYYNASSPYGDTYDSPSRPWALEALADTVGNPSGPGVWPNPGSAYWIGYDASTGEWGVYTGTTPARVAGTALSGPALAIAKVSVDNASPAVATFQVSFDGGVSFSTLYTRADATWTNRGYYVQSGAVYSVEREQRT
ncbi:MAG: hypothetical protein WC538_21195 [Thermoanaerobaculia bacterium]|jgi:hypothetical protein